MTPVRAQATVDQIRFGPAPMWEVEVNGLPPHDHRRVYQIEARNDNSAAFQAIHLFSEEMDMLVGGEYGVS